MRVDRFKRLVTELLTDVEHPGIAKVDTYREPEQDNPVITCSDGSRIYLSIVRTAPLGGGDATDDEQIVTRQPGTKIAVTRRQD